MTESSIKRSLTIIWGTLALLHLSSNKASWLRMHLNEHGLIVTPVTTLFLIVAQDDLSWNPRSAVILHYMLP